MTPRGLNTLFVSALACLFLPGCIYLHNPRNQATADAALTDFQTFREKSANPYSTMLKNLEKAKAASAAVAKTTSEAEMAGAPLGLPFKTWADVGKDLKTEQDRLASATSALDTAVTLFARDFKTAKKEAGHAGKKLEAVKKDLAEEFDRVQRWTAQQALFKAAIVKIAEESTKRDRELTPQDVTEPVQDLLDTEITVQKLENDTVKTEKKKIGDVLGSGVKGKTLPDLVKSLSEVVLDLEASPGIAITILGLAVDLADAAHKRERVRLAILTRKHELLEAMARNIELSRGLVDRAKTYADGRGSSKVLEDMRGHATAPPPPPGHRDPVVLLTDDLGNLGRAAVAMITMSTERQRLEVELATLAHEHSIRLSAINAQAHEALIGRGLEGLAAYHRGGVTPEEIANVIRAAQAIAVAVIGGLL